jgi:hypothetical protein
VAKKGPFGARSRSTSTQAKFIEDSFEKKEVTIITPEGEVGSNLVPTFKEFLKQKGKAPCFAWYHAEKQLSWLDPPVLKSEFKRFRQLVREGVYKVLEVNLTTQTYSKREWYSVVLAKTDGSGHLDIASFKLFNYMVDGLVYWFSNKNNRDAYYRYLVAE